MMYGPTREPAVSGMGAVYDEAGPGVAVGTPPAIKHWRARMRG